MSPDPRHPDTWNQSQDEPAGAAPSHAEGQAQERADVEEDRRRQRELDEAEMGGES
jgi:hypothetical protein